jgi:hypothetical protein
LAALASVYPGAPSGDALSGAPAVETGLVVPR